MKRIANQLKKMHNSTKVYFDGILWAVVEENKAFIYRVIGKTFHLQRKVVIV